MIVHCAQLWSRTQGVKLLHEFEPLPSCTKRKGFDIQFVLFTVLISRTILYLMTDVIFVLGFGCGIFFHIFRFPEVEGSSVEDSRAWLLFITSFTHIHINSWIDRWSNITILYAWRQKKKDLIDVLKSCDKISLQTIKTHNACLHLTSIFFWHRSSLRYLVCI
jgi:hypothetical protein